MRFFFTLLFVTFSIVSHTQIDFNKTKHDFGELLSYSIRHYDFQLKNNGNKKEWILKVEKNDNVKYIRSKEFINPDSTVTLRLYVSPKTTGKFNYSILVYTSDRNDPIKLTLTGNNKELENNSTSIFNDCPTFDEIKPGKNQNTFDLKVITIDKETRTELQNTQVTMYQQGFEKWTETTDKNGLIKQDATLGLSYFSADHQGYLHTEKGAYVNFKRNVVVIELERSKDPINSFTDSIVSPAPTPSDYDLVTDFQTGNYAPVNIVFVLDVSSSMRHADKMELMQYALTQLAGDLRDFDQIGIVTYSSDARVILPSTKCINKGEIFEQVEQLKAGGYTAGGDGIKLGFKTAIKGFIPDGVNQIVVITDGAFNRGDDDYKKYIKKYSKKGVSMSVVGIKTNGDQARKMKEVADLGLGEFVSISNINDAKLALLIAIMKISKKI